MNRLAEAMLDQYATDLAHATDLLLEAVRRWEGHRRKVNGCELRAARCAISWNKVLWEAHFVCSIVEDWQRIGIEAVELKGRLQPGAVPLLSAALEVDELRRGNAHGPAYEAVCQRLRKLATKRVEDQHDRP